MCIRDREDTLWRCANIPRIICVVSFPGQSGGRDMILFKWSNDPWYIGAPSEGVLLSRPSSWNIAPSLRPLGQPVRHKKLICVKYYWQNKKYTNLLKYLHSFILLFLSWEQIQVSVSLPFGQWWFCSGICADRIGHNPGAHRSQKPQIQTILQQSWSFFIISSILNQLYN